jgi:hypothetical protein
VKYNNRRMPPCPICKKIHTNSCGLRLFNSENECPICLEKKTVMIALPCGHQFCKEDLARIGFVEGSRILKKIKRSPRRPVNIVSTIRRIITHQPHRRTTVQLPIIVQKRRRCGWCGHVGHRQRTCPAHRQQCGCKTYKTARHKRLHKTKTTCTACLKKGHRYRTCTNVIKGIK